MSIDAAERAELEHLRRVTRLAGVVPWHLEVGAGELADQPFVRAIHPDDRVRVLRELAAHLAGPAERYESEHRVCRDGADPVWVRARGETVRDTTGRAVRMSGASVDVTDYRRQVEQLRTAIELAGASTWNFEVVDGELMQARFGSGTTTFTGLGYAQVEAPADLREGILLAIHPEDQPALVAAFQACIDGTSDGFEVEYRIRHKGGELRWRLGRGVAIREPGRPPRIVGTSVEISRIKQAQDEATAANAALAVAAELSGLAVTEFDLRGATHVDDAMFRIGSNLTGHRQWPRAAPGEPTFRHRIIAEDLLLSTAATRAAIASGEDMLVEYRTRDVEDGPLRWRLARGRCFYDDRGAPIRFIGVSLDIQQLKQAQEDTRTIETQLRLATTQSGVTAWSYDLHGRDRRGDDPAATPADLAPTIARLAHPDDQPRLAAAMQACIDGAIDHLEVECRVGHRDGGVEWRLVRGALVHDERGGVTRVTGTSVDITRIKQVEGALRDSEDRFRRTFENAAVGMILTDVEGRFLEYNARFCEFLGYSREELAGRRFVEFMVPDEVADDLQRQRAVVRGDLPWFTRDKQYVRKDGSRVWGNITVSVIQRDADGRPAHVMGILQDITERKQLEVELEAAQARMQLAMRGSDLAVFDGLLPNGDFAASTWTHFNMWEPMGYDPREVPTDASHVTLNVHADDLPAALAQFEAAIQTRQSEFYLEHRFVRKDGSVRWRLTRGTFLFDAAGVLNRFLGTSTDITRLKEIEAEVLRAREAAESANRAKDDFLANVSHEIRTPMNAILGMTELALDATASEHQRQLLSTVRSAAKNLLTIVNDLLDFSKIASGKLTLDRADFSLRAAVGDTLRALAVRAHRKGLELLCHVQPDVPDALDGDAGRLRQVLMNLVGNAIKFTAQGEVEVGVEADRSRDDSVALIFTVRDTGIGIARDKQAAIFHAFEQEDSSTTRRYGGTGLGLTISAQLAALMGGTITVQSAPGCGSTFRFTARFARSSRPDAAAMSPERLANLRVLVVDDNDTNRRILVEWLISWRMQPTSATSAAEALAALASGHAAGTPYALVLLDARMPDTDGVSLAAEIGRRWESRAPRLILLSSDDSAELAARARDHGVLAYLLKPVQQSELLEAIWAVMNLDPAVGQAAGAPGSQPERARSLRVLVAEDNELNIALLRELLGQRGHVAQFARDGRAALELAVNGTFYLMLLDLHMPELDGFEVVRAIRTHERDTDRHLRIIALTARSSARDRERCLAAGMDEFLAKPIEAAALWAMMDRLAADLPPGSAPTPRPIEPGLLDARAILRACGGQAAVLETLRVVLRQTLPGQLARIHAALEAGDLAEVREAAHQLVATVGAFSTVTAGTASSLEDAAVREDRDSCAALVLRLDSLCAQLLDATAALTIESLAL